MSSLISVSKISKFFGSTHALKNVSTEIFGGRITGLVGADGAGKTTLLRIICGLLPPDKGEARIDNNFSIGYMPQKFGLYEDLTVMENLELYASLHNIPKKSWGERFDEILNFTQLSPFTGRLAGRLSGGMKQKLGLGCTILSRPDILLMDEPGVGVDPLARRELWNIVRGLLSPERAVVWSTAYLNEAEACDTVILLNDGEILFDGHPSVFAAGSNFQEAFIKILGGERRGNSNVHKFFTPRPRGEEIVKAENLTKKFGKFTAVDNISFSVKGGEILGLLGPNGAGKSTTFKMMCGLIIPTSGDCAIAGVNFKDAPGTARSRLGYMAQKFSLYGDLSVIDNLEFFSGIYGIVEKKKIIELVTETFELGQYLKNRAAKLPLGIKQRLAMGCAIMHGPDVLFLDEPTSGVDPVTRREFWNYIRDIAANGVAVMVTTHFMDEAEYCDKIAFIYKGKIVALGAPRELMSPTLEDAFINLTRE